MKGMKRMKQLQSFTDGYINLPVRQTEEGNIEFDVEQVAVGIGLTHLATSGNLVVRWDRVRKYLSCPEVGTGDFITEPQFYELAIKANSKKAKKFQYWVTHEVLPSIRETGTYSVDKSQSGLRAKRLAIMEDNKRTRQANALYAIAMEVTDENSKEYMLQEAAKLITGRDMHFDNQDFNGYSATFIAGVLGISSQLVGRIANQLGIKAPAGESNKYGHWVMRTTDNNSYPQWLYTDEGATEVATELRARIEQTA